MRVGVAAERGIRGKKSLVWRITLIFCLLGVQVLVLRWQKSFTGGGRMDGWMNDTDF